MNKIRKDGKDLETHADSVVESMTLMNQVPRVGDIGESVAEVLETFEECQLTTSGQGWNKKRRWRRTASRITGHAGRHVAKAARWW